MNQNDFISELSKLRPAATFLSLKHYKNSYGEVANFNIIFHMSYENALKRSIMALDCIVPENDLYATAKRELTDGYYSSLDRISKTPIEELNDEYTRFFDSDGKYIKGVKVFTKTNTLHLYGLVYNKHIIVQGAYPVRNKKALTIAKDNLRKLCPVSKFREFKITADQVQQISVEHLSLLPPV